jgi:hypothetical protein
MDHNSQTSYCLVASCSVCILRENIEKDNIFSINQKLLLRPLIDANDGCGRPFCPTYASRYQKY